MLNKGVLTLNLDDSSDAESKGVKPSKAKKSNKIFLQGPPKLEPVPFPEEFKRVLDAEGPHPTLPKHKTKLWSKFYSSPEGISHMLAVPSVAPPVVVLSSAATIPSEGEGGQRMLSIKG